MSTRQKYLYRIKIVFILTICFSVFASDNEKGKREIEQAVLIQKAGKDYKDIFMHYKPPMGRDLPVNREGIGTRGTKDNKNIYLAVLVPNHLALTTKSQPSLFWYLSQPVSSRIELTINDEESVEPVLEKSLDKRDKYGIQHIGLSDYNISLKQGVEYQWFVTIVPDPEQRSKDITAMGMLKYIEPSKEIEDKLAKARGIEIPATYAEEGLWYDALTALCELINKNPDDKALCNERIFLLEQIGLRTVADAEKENL